MLTLSWMRVSVLSFLCAVAWRGKVAESFTCDFLQPSYRKESKRIRNFPTSCQMVRNIDLAEALIFYGTKSIYYNNNKADKTDERIFLPGVEDLIEECKRDETSVIAILDKADDDDNNNNENDLIYFRTETSPAPNPLDLWEAIHTIEIQPKGFGGSSGFGRKAADPERTPLPARCVVLCDTEEKCRAARFAGMRVLSLTDNALADAVMNCDGNDGDTSDLDYYWESITMDDIATPGSFWLNPPLPKDDDGYRVDVMSIIQSYENAEGKTERKEKETNEDDTTDIHNPDEDDDEDYLASILMDIDPL